LHLPYVYRELLEPASIDRVLILDRPVRQIPISYASCSIGSKPGDMLPKKLDAISIAGFTAIELSFRDILSFGKLHLEHDVSPTNYDELCTVAAEIKRLCDNKGLEITTLQPFPNSEGWPEGSNERKDAFDRAHRWIRIMEACKTDMLQARFDLSHFQLQIHSRITGRSERVYQLLTSRLHKPAPPILLS